MASNPPESRRSPCGRVAAALAVAAATALACGPAGGESRAGEPGAPPAVVESERLEPELLRHVVSIPGQLAAQATVELQAEVEGVLASIEFAEGVEVEAGQVLFQMRDQEQRARLQEAEAELALARAVYERTAMLVKRDVSSTAELERVAAERDVAAARVERARVELERMTVRAPFPGIMGALLVAPGERVREETTLARIDSLDRLQLLFHLPEGAVGLVRVGVPVQLRVAPYPGELFSGEIYFVSPSVDPQARRLLVKAWVPNPDRRLRPGLFAEIEAEIERIPDALLVPESALVYGLEGTTVWRLDADDRVHAAPVETGLRQGGRVQIRSGLEAGDRIVTAGVHKVTAGESVKAVAPGTAPVPAEASATPGHPATEGSRKARESRSRDGTS